MNNIEIIIRDIVLDDLVEYKKMIQPNKEYHKFNGPYTIPN